MKIWMSLLSVVAVLFCAGLLACCEGTWISADEGVAPDAGSSEDAAADFEESGDEGTYYYTMDVAVINSIIDNNGLPWRKAGTGGDRIPADWDGVSWSDDGTNRRVVRLDVGGLELSGILDVSGLTALRELDCGSNGLSALDISGLEALETLDCHGNSIESLDVSDMAELRSLYCFDNALTELRAERCMALEIIYCYNNKLTELDASGMGRLAEFNCSYNELVSLDVSGCVNLSILICTENAMKDESAVTGVEDTLFVEWGDEANMSPFLFEPQN